MEFKNEKWEVVEHSWSDTSIYNQDGKTICTLSIYDEDTTEENQEERENEVSEIFNFIACAPETITNLNISNEMLKSVLSLFGKNMALTTKFGIISQIE